MVSSIIAGLLATAAVGLIGYFAEGLKRFFIFLVLSFLISIFVYSFFDALGIIFPIWIIPIFMMLATIMELWRDSKKGTVKRNYERQPDVVGP